MFGARASLDDIEALLAKLLGFDLCPRLRGLRVRTLFASRDWPVPESLEGVTVHRGALKAIERGWGDPACLLAAERACALLAHQLQGAFRFNAERRADLLVECAGRRGTTKPGH